MTLDIVGAGFGRTGTNSLRLALIELGAGPCYHMYEVLADLDTRVPLWVAAAAGKPDWDMIFAGYKATVDWPSASYWKQILAHNPNAKVILSSRSAESWYDSFSNTIAQLMAMPEKLPPHMSDWYTMANGLVNRMFDGRLQDRDQAISVFNAYEADVKASVPADRLLVFQVADGWEPLCRFLNKPVPASPFPCTNNREEFFARLA